MHFGLVIYILAFIRVTVCYVSTPLSFPPENNGTPILIQYVPMTVSLAVDVQQPFLLQMVQVYSPSSSWATFWSLKRQFSSPRLVNARSWVRGFPS